MPENKCKHVLMTTMSTLAYKSVNYYYGKNENGKLFCDGISSLEPGTKYFLSKYRIDEIVVVGTKETIKKGEYPDKTEYADILDVCEEADATQMLGAVSAYAFYKYRIANFLKEKGHVNKIASNQNAETDRVAALVVAKEISEKRREELQDLYEKKCSINPFLLTAEELKMENGKLRNPWTDILSSIRESIEKSFEDTEIYQGYLTKRDEIRNYQEEYWKNLEVEGTADNVLKELKQDNELTQMEKEYCILSLQKMVSEARLGNVIIDLKTDMVNLEIEQGRLQYELNAIKGQRQKTELEYVKYIAFCALPMENRLCPLEQKTISLRFVDEQVGKESTDNISEIVSTLYGDTDEETEIKLYVDMQGGNRTSGYVRNAILSILSSQATRKVSVEEIIGTNFSAGNSQGNEIVNETKRYRIMDLVSGMNAFIRYGKADMIKNYYDLMKVENIDKMSGNKEIKKDGEEDKTKKKFPTDDLINYMIAVDEAISLCNMQALGEAIVGLSKVLKFDDKIELQAKDNQSFVDNVFQILKDGIKKDYGKLLELSGSGNGNEEQTSSIQEIDYVELIEWCTRKGFLQQALTLIEDKMPMVYNTKKILTCRIQNPSDEAAFLENCKPSYETRKPKKYFENVPKGKATEDLLWAMLWRLQRRDNSADNIGEKNRFERMSDDDKKNYVRQKLITCANCSSNAFVVNDVILKNMISDMEMEQDSNEFAQKYCRFRSMERDYESDKAERDLVKVYNLYDLGKDKISVRRTNADKILYGSILAYTQIDAIFKDRNQMDHRGRAKEIKIEVKRHTSLRNEYEKLLDEALLLHEALKQERNCSNHASEKGIRLPKELIIRAIDVYVEKMRIIMEKIS